MGKYKFKIGQEVWAYTSFSDECRGKIKKRVFLNPVEENKEEKGFSYIEIPIPVCNIQYQLDNSIWYPESAIHENSMENSLEAICSKNGCELVNDLLEGNNTLGIDLDEETKIEIEFLEKQISIKEVEIQVVKNIFKESLDRLEREQNRFLYRKACLIEDTLLMKVYLLDAIE